MAAPLRVLHLLHDSRRSGVPAVVYSLLTSLDRSEILPSAFFAYDGVYGEDLMKAGIEVMALAKSRTPFFWRFYRFLGIASLFRLVQRYDVIHAHSVKTAPMALVAKLLGAKVVFHLHEKVGKKGRLLRALLARADRVIFCAQNCADHYAGIPVKGSETILNAIQVPQGDVAPQEARRRMIVMLGSINRNKGQDILVRAFARLRPKETELRLYGTVGLSARGYVKNLKSFVADNRLEGSISFPGPTHDAPGVFREAYLLVHSSLNECLSISILEAMAYGVPVIANDIAGMREIIEDGVNGFLVPPGDVEALAAKISLLLEDPELWRKMAAAGRETVERRFDMKVRAADFTRMYQEIASCGEKRCSA